MPQLKQTVLVLSSQAFSTWVDHQFNQDDKLKKLVKQQGVKQPNMTPLGEELETHCLVL